jgi:hypothetical protein
MNVIDAKLTAILCCLAKTCSLNQLTGALTLLTVLFRPFLYHIIILGAVVHAYKLALVKICI